MLFGLFKKIVDSALILPPRLCKTLSREAGVFRPHLKPFVGTCPTYGGRFCCSCVAGYFHVG